MISSLALGVLMGKLHVKTVQARAKRAFKAAAEELGLGIPDFSTAVVRVRKGGFDYWVPRYGVDESHPAASHPDFVDLIHKHWVQNMPSGTLTRTKTIYTHCCGYMDKHKITVSGTIMPEVYVSFGFPSIPEHEKEWWDKQGTVSLDNDPHWA